MKIIILAGGLGTRISEETTIKPKPMIEIGGASGPVAHHENLQPLWLHGFHRLPWL